jgi:hypothetical protein
MGGGGILDIKSMEHKRKAGSQQNILLLSIVLAHLGPNVLGASYPRYTTLLLCPPNSVQWSLDNRTSSVIENSIVSGYQNCPDIEEKEQDGRQTATL